MTEQAIEFESDDVVVEAEEVEAEKAEPAKVEPAPALPVATTGGAPEWVRMPPDMKFPRGKQIMFLRFRADMTDTPWKGERQAICWSINVADKKLAIMRSQGDAQRLSDELTKQMVRSIDGHRADWSGVPGAANIDTWWDEIGEKARSMLQRIFLQLHVADREQVRDFFESCVAVRVAS